jgi:hypothetical protein
MEQEELAEYRELVRAEVYRQLKRLEAAETLLCEAHAAIDDNEWPDLADRIAEFLAEG